MNNLIENLEETTYERDLLKTKMEEISEELQKKTKDLEDQKG